MTLLSMCQQVANSIGVTAPATIIGNTDPTAIQLLAAAQDEGPHFARRPQGGWTLMMTENVFLTNTFNATGTVHAGTNVIDGISDTSLILPGMIITGTGLLNNSQVSTVSTHSVTMVSPYVGQSTATSSLSWSQVLYTLPTDFDRMIDDTLWDRTRYWQMRGAQSPQQWQLYKSSVIGMVSIQRRWRVVNFQGTDYFSVNPYPTDNGSTLVYEYVSTGWCKSASGVRQTQWLADTDTAACGSSSANGEYCMRLGIKWRMLERLGLSYSSALNEYERECDKEQAYDGGNAILDLAPLYGTILVGPYNIQEGNFPS